MPHYARTMSAQSYDMLKMRLSQEVPTGYPMQVLWMWRLNPDRYVLFTDTECSQFEEIRGKYLHATRHHVLSQPVSTTFGKVKFDVHSAIITQDSTQMFVVCVVLSYLFRHEDYRHYQHYSYHF